MVFVLLNVNPISAGDPPKVVASIKPIQAIAAAVMAGVSEPGLIIESSISPHHHSLKPSQAQMVSDADLVFWIGPMFEGSLAKLMQTHGHAADPLVQTAGLDLLQRRRGGVWADHDHHAGHDEDDGSHEEHDDHDEHSGHDEDGHSQDDHSQDDHSQDDHSQDDHSQDDHSQDDDAGDHAASTIDMHIWLSLGNSAILAEAMARRLGQIDPDRGEIYSANALRFRDATDQLNAEIAAKLGPLKDRPFIVFHDAFQYFEAAFGLNGAGAVMIEPELKPGAATIADLRETIKARDVACVFAEPQFDPAIAKLIIEQSEAGLGILDPIGVGAGSGATAYLDMMRGLADEVAGCLSQS